MSSKTKDLILADALTDAAGEMTPAQLRVFRSELAARLPGIIEAASQAARGTSDGEPKGVNVMAENNYAPSVRATIRGFRDRRFEIERNHDLSSTGQARQLQALRNEQDAYRPEAHRKLKITWWQIRKDYSQWFEQAAQAEDKAGARWDFGRLDYLASAARAAVKNSDDFEMASRLYNQAINSGDSHKARAWLENGPEALATRFGATHGREVNQLGKAAARQLTQVLDTPELAKLRQAGSELTERGREAYEATQEAGQFYDPAAGNPFSIRNEFGELLEGIQLTEHVEAETLATTYTLSIAEAAPVSAGQEV